MKNSKLEILLSKLNNEAEQPTESVEFTILDDKCEHLKGITGRFNDTCNNGGCTGGNGGNGTCINTGCSGGTNNSCTNNNPHYTDDLPGDYDTVSPAY